MRTRARRQRTISPCVYMMTICMLMESQGSEGSLVLVSLLGLHLYAYGIARFRRLREKKILITCHLYAYGIARFRRLVFKLAHNTVHLYAYGIARFRRHVLFLNIFMFHLYTYGITRYRRDE